MLSYLKIEQVGLLAQLQIMKGWEVHWMNWSGRVYVNHL